jgi:hypothetical protein
MSVGGGSGAGKRRGKVSSNHRCTGHHSRYNNLNPSMSSFHHTGRLDNSRGVRLGSSSSQSWYNPHIQSMNSFPRVRARMAQATQVPRFFNHHLLTSASIERNSRPPQIDACKSLNPRQLSHAPFTERLLPNSKRSLKNEVVGSRRR